MTNKERDTILKLLYEICCIAEDGMCCESSEERYYCLYDISNFATAAVIILDTEEEQ